MSSSDATVTALQETIDQCAHAVHTWRVNRLTRLGLAWPVAEAVADRVDWYEVTKLMQRGCPPALAVTILD